MAPFRSSSTRRLIAGFAGMIVVPLAIFACNGIIGLSDYTRVECTGLVCDGGVPFDVASPDGSRDGGVDASRGDASGAKPVSWAAWRMPNYGPDADNPMSFEATPGGMADKVTGLVWRHPMPPEAGNQTFEGAQKLCSSIKESGPWRLPSRIELVTLLDLSQSGARIDPVFKTDVGTHQGVYWTSSEVRPFVAPDREYWVVDFSGASVIGKRGETGGNASVRCVKGAR